MLIWVPGLLFLLFGREGRRYRVLGVIYVAAFVVLLANPHAKAEYLGPAYTMLFAAGGVAVERWASRGRRGWAPPALAALSVVTSLAILPMAVAGPAGRDVHQVPVGARRQAVDPRKPAAL